MKARQRAQAAIYAALFVVLIGSAALYLSQYATNLRLWEQFTYAYLLLLVAYTWWLFALLLVHEACPRTYAAYEDEKIAVIIPCFNESADLVEESIRTVLAAEGRKQVIVIDDGSTNGVQERLLEIATETGITVAFQARNLGKREALYLTVTHLLDEDVDFVVTIDSDTVLESDALVRIVEPLKSPSVGAATGNVLLLNEWQNLLTRMIGTYYWIGLNIYKQAQSVIRSVVCCSGCLAAYRASLIKEIIDEFVDQRFLGEPCTHSEDRHLTNLVLRRNYDVVYVDEAVSWTETPATVRGFLRQQRRWKRGYIRESIYTLSYAWRNKRLLFLQILLWDLTAPFLSLGLRIGLVVTAIQAPQLLLTVILPSWIVLMLVRFVFVPLRAREKLPGLFLYMLFYEGCLYWLNIWALFTVKNRSWVTRQAAAQA